MADKIGDAFVEIGAKTGSFNRKMKRTSGILRGVGAMAAKAALAIGGVFAARAIIRGAVQATRAYMEQEDAINSLAAAITGAGGNVTAMSNKFQNFAAQMQRVTVHGDELILQTMAYGRNLGIQTDQLEDATTAAAGLSAKYRIDLATAMMLVGRASQGQTQMLTRYGIVMDESMSDQEKFNSLLKIGADAFRLSEAELKTLGGQFKSTKNAIGDAKEGIGEMVTDLIDLRGMLGLTGDDAVTLGDKIKDMADAGVFIMWSETIKATGKRIWPGTEPGCRCTCRSVIKWPAQISKAA